MDNLIELNNMIFKKNKDGKTVTLVEFNESENNVIPDNVEGLEVKTIAKRAFNNIFIYEQVVVIPSNVKYICEKAFVGCKMDLYVKTYKSTFHTNAFYYSEGNVYCDNSEMSEINGMSVVSKSILDSSMNYIYRLKDSKVSVLKYINPSSVYTIPSLIDGHSLPVLSNDLIKTIFWNIRNSNVNTLDKLNLVLLLDSFEVFGMIASTFNRIEDFIVNLRKDELDEILLDYSENYSTKSNDLDCSVLEIRRFDEDSCIKLIPVGSNIVNYKDGVKFFVKNNGIHILSVDDSIGSLPSLINDIEVTNVNESAFVSLVNNCYSKTEVAIPIRFLQKVFSESKMFEKFRIIDGCFYVLSKPQDIDVFLNSLDSRYRIEKQDYYAGGNEYLIFVPDFDIFHKKYFRSVKLLFIKSDFMKYEIPRYLGNGTFTYYIEPNGKVYISSFDGDSKSELLPYNINGQIVRDAYKNNGGNYFPAIYINRDLSYKIYNNEFNLYKGEWLYTVKEGKAMLKYYIGYLRNDFDNTILVPNNINGCLVEFSYNCKVMFDAGIDLKIFDDYCTVQLEGSMDDISNLLRYDYFPVKIRRVIFVDFLQKHEFYLRNAIEVMENIEFFDGDGEPIKKIKAYIIEVELSNKREVKSKNTEEYFGTWGNGYDFSKIVLTETESQAIVKHLPNQNLHDESWQEEEYDSDGAFGYPLRSFTKHEKYYISDITYKIVCIELYENIMITKRDIFTALDAQVMEMPYVENQPAEVQIAAVKYDPHLITAIKKPSSEALTYLYENKICPRCGSGLRYKSGRYGSFFGCSSYPECMYTTN